MQKALLTLYAASYLHPGAGSASGVIDLPIHREVHSGSPVIPASGLKGALRQKVEKHADADVLFGSKTGGDHAGAISLGEAKLLALPVRSLRNVFQWVSSPLVMNGFLRDLARMGTALPDVPIPQEGHAVTPSDSEANRIVLEELDFQASTSTHLDRLLQAVQNTLPQGAGSYLLDKFLKDFALVPDEEFRHLCRVGTQVSARIQLDENKTSKNLWYEESLPPETIFYAIVLAQKSRSERIMSEAEVMDSFRQNAIESSDGLVQIGGNETIGQGWCCSRLWTGETI